jgi:uncharacterized protein (AIM24 family)
MAKQHHERWEICGDSMQAAVVTVPPGKGVVGEAGTMLFVSDAIEVETGLSTKAEEQPLVAGLVEAVKRRLAGDTFFVTRFFNRSKAPAEVAFAAPFPGKILKLELDEHPDGVILQREAFLCGSLDIAIAPALQRNILAGLFGGEGFILQKVTCSAPGAVVLAHASGTLLERELAAGESLRIDVGCVVAYEPSVGFDVKVVSNLPTILFAGRGAFFATLTGPGRVWMQTMPLARMAAHIWEAAPQRKALAADQERVAREAVEHGVKKDARA